VGPINIASLVLKLHNFSFCFCFDMRDAPGEKGNLFAFKEATAFYEDLFTGDFSS
jgi:hypothetical protein